ncbi:histidine--tRNA ligase [Candidatus Saccharibacteria bacterium]|nr:histidine--tRNA ligase [Candidatus Saccharibacteria bacterium]
MKKLNTSPISGMQELLPEKQAIFNQMKRQIEEVYRLHGFLNIETPMIDRTEILFAKAGGETEKQIYRVYKTGESAEESREALRFDHTVPLARYVTEHETDLAFPFRVSQIGRNFRGERAQKGRFREFYQCDIDVVSRNSLPIEYDVDVILTLFEALEKILPRKRKLVRISNRKILSGFLEELNLQEVKDEIFSIIDHAEKVLPEKTRENLESLNIGEERVAQVLAFINLSGKREAVLAALRGFGFENETFKEGLEELDRVFSLLESQGLEKSIILDMKIIRGLDYYTGTVFETILPDFPKLGSVCSGGRYENLAELYSEQKFPGAGGSIGLTRLFSVLDDSGILPESEVKKPVDLAIIPVSASEVDYCFGLSEELREEGKNVDLVLADKKLGDKLKYASKIAASAIVIGPDEVASGNYSIKTF